MKTCSVIIPAYNSENTIEKTIQSVLNQDYADIEIIVVNDGSTDHTEAVVKKFDQVKYFHQENAGVSFARNLGLEKSTGYYIQYLDADDLLAPNKIKVQVDAIVNGKADVAYGDWTKFTEEQNEYKELEFVKRSMIKRPEIELFTSFWVPLAGLLYTRNIVDKIGKWNTALPIIQDARYALDAAINGAKFVYTEGNMAFYRVHTAGSLSTKSKISFMNDCLINAIQIDAIWRKEYIHDKEKKEAVLDSLRFCINEFSGLDKSKHQQAIDLILDIDPQYIPKGSKILTILSKILGYRNAERIAYYKRKLS